MLNKTTVAIGLLALSGGAFGADKTGDSQGFYVGFGIGRNTLKDSSVDFDASDTAFKLFGGYSINPYLAVEGSYIDGGSPSQDFFGSEVSVDTTAFDASLVGSYPFTPQFSLLGRLGVMFWDEKASGFGLTASESGNDLSYGIGAGFHFSPNSHLRLEWQSADTELDVSIISASIAWKFN